MGIREGNELIFPDPEFHEEFIDLEYGGKRMELHYAKNAEPGLDKFFIYIENSGEDKIPGATTALLVRAVEIMRAKVNESGRPAMFVLDPVATPIKLWAKTTKVSEIVGGWDVIQNDQSGMPRFLRKTFYPNS